MRLVEVANWLKNTVSERAAPPMFQVPPFALNADREQGRFSSLDGLVQRRIDSGVLEMRFNKSQYRMTADPARTAMEIARQEDPERKFLELVPDHEGSQFRISRTLIESLPVLGPGGNVLIQNSEATFMADITVRSRILPRIVSERWNSPRMVYRSLVAEIDPFRNDLEITAWLGYFELSKYDAQRLIRPVFMFLIQSRSKFSQESYVAWETTRVQPATLSKSIAEREGLGVSE